MGRTLLPRTAGTIRLTPRELEYIRHVCARDEPKAILIAGRMGITPKTLETHRANAYRKLGVHGHVQLLHRAVELGLIPCPCCWGRVEGAGATADE